MYTNNCFAAESKKKKKKRKQKRQASNYGRDYSIIPPKRDIFSI